MQSPNQEFLEWFITTATSYTPKGSEPIFWTDAVATLTANLLHLLDAAGVRFGPDTLKTILASFPEGGFKAHMVLQSTLRLPVESITCGDGSFEGFRKVPLDEARRLFGQ